MCVYAKERERLKLDRKGETDREGVADERERERERERRERAYFMFPGVALKFYSTGSSDFSLSLSLTVYSFLCCSNFYFVIFFLILEPFQTWSDKHNGWDI